MFEKVKETFNNHKLAVYTVGGSLATAGAGLPVVCHASGGEGSSSTVQSALTNAFSQVQTDAMSYIQSALTPALVIMGTVLAITIGIKVFKRFTKG